jgi:hypothetical protein
MKVAILHIIEPKTLGTVVEFSTNYKNKKQKTKGTDLFLRKKINPSPFRLEPGNKGDQAAHFNLRPIENTRTGKIPSAKDHFYFKE